jgi:predicted ATP-grasp superfamily ATP-dependent carboligase
VPTAVVLGVGGPAGVSAIRILGRRGIRVYAVDHLLSPLGFRSRYAAVKRRVPDPERDDAGFAAALHALGDELGGGVPIFPTRDEDLNGVARNRDALGGRFAYPFPSWELLRSIQDKRFQVEQAQSLGIPTPATSSETIDRFPVLVKPARPAGFRRRFGTQALRCESSAELERALNETRDFDPLVQEVVPGPDSALYTLGAYVDTDGNALGVFCGRKLRQSPRGVGTCRVGEALWSDEVVEQGLKILHGIGFTGIAQVEFKHDRRDGRFKFIEINPRLWQWHENAAVCGVDLAWTAFKDLTGDSPAFVDSRECRKRWALTFYGNVMPAFTRPPYVDPLFSREDPRLALMHLARVTRNTFRRA